MSSYQDYLETGATGQRAGSKANEVLNRIRGELGAPGATAAPNYLGGVPYDPNTGQGYRARIPAIPSALSRGGPAGIGHAGTVGPRYTKGSEYQLFQGKDPAYISRIQAQLITSGLLDPQHGTPGRWTPQTAQAMEAVLGHANWAGQSWHGALGDLVEAGEIAGYGQEEFDPGFISTPFVPRTRLDPDPKVARQKVKDLIGQIVGEEYATPEIIDKYVASLITDYHRQFNQEERFRREQHMADETIRESQYDYSVGEGEIVGEEDLSVTKSATAIDPESNLRAELEKRFAGVKEGIKEHDLAQDRPVSFFNSLNSLINMGTAGESQEL